MTPPMSGPTTPAERSLLAFLWEERKHARFDGPELVKRIAAVAAEARADATGTMTTAFRGVQMMTDAIQRAEQAESQITTLREAARRACDWARHGATCARYAQSVKGVVGAACDCGIDDLCRILPNLPAAAQAHEARIRADAVQEWRVALEDCALQFGYRVEGPAISTAGLSALEDAFDLLGWDDPHPLDESQGCDIKGCRHPSTSGLIWGDLYLRLCHNHTSDCFVKKDRPAVKQHALDREATRGPDGVLPARTLLDAAKASEGTE